MTVIASYNHFGCGLVIGDILINGPVEDDNLPQTSLPTLGNVANFFSGAWGIHSSAQKVCIISDHCALAWADSQLYARFFVTHLTKLSKRITLTKKIIERVYKKYAEDKIQIAGAIYEDGGIQTFGFGCNQLKCPILGDVYSGGSGASIVQDYLDIVKSMDLSMPREDEICANAVSLALTQVAHLLNAEFRKGDAADSILELFGGGYEIAAFYDGKFHKITSNFLFLDVGVEGGVLKVGNPRLLINQTYSESTLCFQSITTRGAFDDEVVRNEDIGIPAFSGHRSRQPTVSSDTGLNWGCFVFVDNFRFKGEQLISLIIKSETPPVDYAISDGNLTLLYSSTAGRQIENFLKHHYLRR